MKVNVSGVRNVNFSLNFAKALNEWSVAIIGIVIRPSIFEFSESGDLIKQTVPR